MDIRKYFRKKRPCGSRGSESEQKKKANVIAMNRWNTRYRFEQCSRQRVRR